MANTWKVQDARKHFDELLQASLAKGPQIVAEDGVEVAALLPIEHWRRLEKMPGRSLKELLLAPEARTGSLVPPRVRRPRRPPPSFD